MQIHTQALMLLLLQLTPNLRARTDAHPFPYPLLMATRRRVPVRKLIPNYSTILRPSGLPPFFPLPVSPSLNSSRHGRCIYGKERLLQQCVFENLGFWQYPSQPGSTQAIRVPRVISHNEQSEVTGSTTHASF